MKRTIYFLLLLCLLSGYLPQTSDAADVQAKETIPSSTSTFNESTYSFNLAVPSIKFDTVSYSGAGTIKSKWIDGGKLWVVITGESVAGTVTDVVGYDSKDTSVYGKIYSNPGNAVWRYADGKRWQINTVNPYMGNRMESFDVTGQNFDSGGVSQSPIRTDVTTVASPDVSGANYWYTPGNGSWLPDSSSVDTATLSACYAEKDPAAPWINSTTWQGTKLVVNYTIPTLPERPGIHFGPAYGPPPPGQTLGGNVVGRMYYAPYRYALCGKTKPVTTYKFGGTLTYSYDSGPDPSVTTSMTVTPSLAKYDGSNVTVKVKVDGTATNIKTSDIVKWTLFVRNDNNGGTGEREEYSQDITTQTLTVSKEFTFTIPASLVTGTKYDDKYAARAVVYLATPYYQGNLATGVSTVTKSDIAPAPSLPPSAPSNLPPNASLSAPYSVMMGDKARVNAGGSSDPDGTIVGYYWELDGGSPEPEGSSGDVYFTSTGTKNIAVTVSDNGGATASAYRSIIVEAPRPAAIFNYLGSLKENRKVTIDASASIAPVMYPIDHNKTTWEITPVSGGTASDVKFEGTATGRQKDVLFKKAGVYNVKCTVQSTYGTTDTQSKLITILPDEKPIANFEVLRTVYRDRNNTLLAEINVSDSSRSVDGDTIQQRIWTYYFDSDNDGSFTDETLNLLDSTNKTSLKFNVASVGRYLVELEVVEAFGQPTISTFITTSDYRIGTTWE